MKTVLQMVARVLQIAVTVVLALLLGCNLWLIAQRALGVSDPTVFGYSVAVVASGSMEPALSVDDVILNHAQDRYAVGDIITFSNGTALTTHRIVAETDAGYITRGDANNTDDAAPVAPQAVVGRVVGTISGAGRLLAVFKSPVGLTVLLFAGLVLLELPLLFRIARNEREETAP